MQPHCTRRSGQQKVKHFAFILYQCVALCICTDTIKNNHNYTVQIIHFFKKKFKLYMYQLTLFLNNTFQNFISIYIYIYNLELNQFQTLLFLHPIMPLPQKLKTQMDMWLKIRLHLKSNLESNWIWTLRFLHSIIHLAQNLKLNGIHGSKLRIQLKSNWIFSEIWLLIYIYIYYGFGLFNL